MKTQKPLPKFKIGTYQLGYRMVDLYADPNGLGAWFSTCCDRQHAQIHVGMNYSDLAEAHGILMHEVFEMAMDDNCCAFKPKAFQENASDTYRFFMDHNQFTEIAARAAFFMFTAFDDFKKSHLLCLKNKKQLSQLSKTKNKKRK